MTLDMLASIGISVHLISYLTDLHYEPAFAAGIAGLIGAMSLPSRLLYNFCGNRLPRRFVLTCIFLLQTLSLLALLNAHTTLGIIAFAILFGAANSAMTPARASLVADLYGSSQYGSISGVLALFITAARLVPCCRRRAARRVWRLRPDPVGIAGYIGACNRDDSPGYTPFSK